MINKKTGAWVMPLELLFGIILSLVYIKFVLYRYSPFDSGFLVEMIKFYGVLSLLFFFAVYSIGIISAVQLKLTRKIPQAIFYSFGFWIISLIISILLLNTFAILSLYIILIGIIVGFNLGLRRNV